MSDLFTAFDLPKTSPQFECVECGAMFDQPNELGRPQKFCSASCRAVSKARQVREWIVRRGALGKFEYSTCRHCFRVFKIPDRHSGRLPHFCGPACKQASMRPAAIAGPDRPSLFNERNDQ